MASVGRADLAGSTVRALVQVLGLGGALVQVLGLDGTLSFVQP